MLSENHYLFLIFNDLWLQSSDATLTGKLTHLLQPLGSGSSHAIDVITKCIYNRSKRMKYEWDFVKNEENIKKHGIDFSDVPSMFNYPMLTGLDQRKDYGEDRWLGIGMLKDVVAVIVFTEKDRDTLRIISARKATTYEIKKYREALQN